MAVVTIAEAWPTVSRPFTVYDLDRMPDEGPARVWATRLAVGQKAPRARVRTFP